MLGRLIKWWRSPSYSKLNVVDSDNESNPLDNEEKQLHQVRESQSGLYEFQLRENTSQKSDNKKIEFHDLPHEEFKQRHDEEKPLRIADCKLEVESSELKEKSGIEHIEKNLEQKAESSEVVDIIELESILNTLITSSTAYIMSIKLIKKFFFTKQGSFAFLGGAGSAIGLLYFIDLFLSHIQNEDNLFNSCDIQFNCQLDYQNITNVCNDMLNQWCEEMSGSYAFYVSFGMVGSGALLIFFLKKIIDLVKPIINLQLSDFLTPTQLALLEKHHIKSDMFIHDGIEAVQALIQSQNCARFLPNALWKIVEGYLAPLDEKGIFPIEVEKEEKVQSDQNIILEAKKDVTHNHDFNAIQSDAEENKKSAELSLETIKEISKATEEKEEDHIASYSVILFHTKKIKALTEKNSRYCKAAEDKVTQGLQVVSQIENKSEEEIEQAKDQLHIANEVVSVTKAIQNNITLFSTEALAICEDLRIKANNAAEVDKNKDSLQVIRRMAL